MPPKGWKKQSEEIKSSSQGDETDTFSENKGEHGASDKGLSMSAVQNKEKKDVVSLDDLLLPKSIISRIAKSSIPEGSTIPSDGQLALQRSASVFISYLCSEANEFAAKSKRKTIMPQDISKALEELEFASFIPTVVARVEEFEQGVLAKKKVNAEEEEEEDEIEDDEILEIEHGEENTDAADEPPSKKHKGRKPGRKAGSGTSSSAYASAGLYKKKSKMNEDDDDEDDDEEDEEEDEEEEETTKKRGRKKGTDDTDKKAKGRKKKDEEDKKERKKPGRKKKGPKPGSEEGDTAEGSGDPAKSQSKEPGEPSQPEEPAETKDDNSDEENAAQV